MSDINDELLQKIFKLKYCLKEVERLLEEIDKETSDLVTYWCKLKDFPVGKSWKWAFAPNLWHLSHEDFMPTDNEVSFYGVHEYSRDEWDYYTKIPLDFLVSKEGREKARIELEQAAIAKAKLAEVKARQAEEEVRKARYQQYLDLKAEFEND